MHCLSWDDGPQLMKNLLIKASVRLQKNSVVNESSHAIKICCLSIQFFEITLLHSTGFGFSHWGNQQQHPTGRFDGCIITDLT